MGRTFELREPIEPPVGLNSPFICGQPGSAPIDVFRMLNGTVDIVRRSNGSRVKCRHSYLTLVPSKPRTNDKKLTRSLFGEEVNVADARRILESLRSLYTDFFTRLSSEIEHCIYLRRRSHYVESFLHFYRALEKLAVAFPVMYITAQSDFQKIHAMLKPLFNKEGGGGELSFVSKFCKKLAEDSDVLGEYKIAFKFPSDDSRYAAITQEIGAIFGGGDLAGQMIKEETYFELPFEHVGPFLIECRNRLFHNSNSGQRNFDIDRLGGASELCQGLVDAGLHWLTLTYIEVIRNRAALV